MAYAKQTWLNAGMGDTPINATRLNHIEDGIEAVADALDTVEEYTTQFLANGYRDGVLTDAQALQQCVTACFNAGGGIVRAHGEWELNDPVVVPQGVDLLGYGSHQDGGATKFTCTTADAGIRFGDLVGFQTGGVSGKFYIDGGEIATEPLYIGLCTSRTFINIDVHDSGGIGLSVIGAQNCLFMEVNILYSLTEAIRVDRAGSCHFMKCEFGMSGQYNLRLMSGGSAFPFTADYPVKNVFDTCLFEYHTATTIASIYQSAGIGNALSNCIVASSSTPSTSLLTLIRLEMPGSAFSADLRLHNCTLQHNFVSANSIGIEIIGTAPRVFGSGVNSIVGSNKGIQRLTTGGGSISYLGQVQTVGVTTNRNTAVGHEGYVDATFIA